MNWYSLRVMSGRENKVKDTIFRELDFEKDLKANVEEILIPTENIVDIKNGKKTVKEKSLLPGYILVKMIMNNETKLPKKIPSRIATIAVEMGLLLYPKSSIPIMLLKPCERE